jgi:CHAT domain
VTHITAEFVEPPTMATLEQAQFQRADIFHYGGHGEFSTSGPETAFGTTLGEGKLVLEDEQHRAAEVSASQLGTTLHAAGIQLALLGACKTAMVDGENRWSSTATALARAEIPCVVGMQFKIWDRAALTFNERFYAALAAGLTLDEAVVMGRLAIFNVVDPLRSDAQFKIAWRDWGIPVLYARGTQPLVLPAIADAAQQQTAQSDLAARSKQEVDTVAGSVTGIKAATLRNARILAEQNIKKVLAGGEVVGLDLGTVESGSAASEQKLGDVEGTAIGIRLDSIGG